MKIALLTAGILAVSVPGLAAAQTACQRASQSNQVAGTVVGAGVGALLGSAIAGHGSGTEGAILGGIGGAVAGNVIAKQSGQPCPTGYYEVPSSAPAYTTAPVAYENLPRDYHDRLAQLDVRIRTAERRGTMTHAQATDALQRLAGLRRQEMDLRTRDGGTLSDADSDFLRARLDEAEHQVGWTLQANADGSVPAPVYRGPSYETSTAAPVGFDGYPEFRGQEARIRGAIADGVRDDDIARSDAADLYAQLNGIRAEESREFRLHGWNPSYDARMHLRSQLDRLDREVDRVRDEP